MTIRPASDIILEVAQSADPARLSAALQKLNTPGADAAFADAMRSAGAGARPGGSEGSVAARIAGLSWPAGAGATRDALSPAQQFESFLLRTFVQSMLPSGKSVYGKGTEADVHKSMLAEQVADQITRAGGLGIAAKLASAGAG